MATLEPVGNAGPLLAPGAVPGGPLLTPEPGPLNFFGHVLKIDFGFEYIQPRFSHRAVTLAVPTSAGAPLLADSGNFSQSFAFVPRFGVDYEFPDLGFGVTASGRLLSISGHLQRALSSTAGSGTLNAQSSVDIAAVNLLEGTRLLYLGDAPCFKETCLEDSTVQFTLGARYSYVRQDYTASLASGPNVASLTATQLFNGFGITSSTGLLQPLFRDFFLYSTARGSVLVGPNNRSSSSSVVVPGSPGASSAATATEDKTSFIGVGEFELGIAWGKPLTRSAAVAAQANAPLLWFRVGWVGQIWGNLGLLSTTDRPQDFSHASLFLQGFSLLAGIDY
jgi:hypothetical protein